MLCRNCDLRPSKTRGRCNHCHSYFLYHGEERPPVWLMPRGGSNNPNWKGDDVSNRGARQRTRKKYALGTCERCERRPGEHRHHRDRNPRNNSSENIEILCTTCHAIEHAGPRQCVNCGRTAKWLRLHRCHSCRSYFLTHGLDRSEELIQRAELRKQGLCKKGHPLKLRKDASRPESVKRFCPTCQNDSRRAREMQVG